VLVQELLERSALAELVPVLARKLELLRVQLLGYPNLLHHSQQALQVRSRVARLE
jgi:hypothetical protein